MCGHIPAVELEDGLKVESCGATCFLVGEYQHDNLTLRQVSEDCRVFCSADSFFKRVYTAAELICEVTTQIIS